MNHLVLLQYSQKTNHNLSANDPITLAGIAFTCSGSTGITTTIFPDPQQSYTVDQVNGVKELSALVGGSKGYPHFYNPAIHYFERARSCSWHRCNNSCKQSRWKSLKWYKV